MQQDAKIFTIPHLAYTSPMIDSKADSLIVERKKLEESFPLHRHEYLEIEFILSGSGYENFNGEHKPIEPGMFYLLRPSDFHEYCIFSPTEILTVSFDCSMLPQIFANHFYPIYLIFIQSQLVLYSKIKVTFQVPSWECKILECT